MPAILRPNSARRLMVPVERGITYGGRCKGTTSYGTIKLPTNLVVGDAILAPQYSTLNNTAAIVQPDGRTVEQVQPLARR
ncbi:hypothetical protein KDAU_66890 [Dictyobacter aurantiacus]|uniref:Uncharacterized protein n=1 Tax=Dictyobacter aurantiacus TaxID=1936993 RepID=A0A401ZRE9_9CHLR|nr:hypothetical protein KDAU_66890 [Dictyobacter aurantiacus]